MRQMRHTHNTTAPWPEASPTQILLLWAEGLRGCAKKARHCISADSTLYVCVQGAGHQNWTLLCGVSTGPVSLTLCLSTLYSV